MNTVSICVLLLMLFAAPLPARAQSSADMEHRIDAYVAAQMQRARIPGLSLAVIQRGEVLIAKGYGYANLEHQVAVTADTLFQSGSVGKQMAATLLMMLVEDGRIGLDDPLEQYFVDAPATWASITVRHLLTHTSGIPDYPDGSLDLRRDYSEEELTRLAYGFTLEFPAGTRYRYSNTGYALLGILIGKVSGRFYGDDLRERVFFPLGMTTARILNEADIIPRRAAGYRLDNDVIKNQEWVAPLLNTTADGSLYLSLHDFIAWDRGLRANALLRPESWAQIYAPLRLKSGKTYPYGFGWVIENIAGQRVLSHEGAWQGFRAQISRFLGDDVSILVLANQVEADAWKIAHEIAALFNPSLVLTEPKPIRDLEPAIRLRAQQLLRQASEGSWSLDDFAFMAPKVFAESLDSLRQRLAKLGAVRSLRLVRRSELGDDRVYIYAAGFKQATQLLRLELTANDKVCFFDLYPQP